MNVYILPALIAFSIKLLILIFSQRTFGTSRPLMILVSIFAIHNLCEILVFWEFFDGQRAEYLLRTYYVISLVSLTWISYYIAFISKQEQRFHRLIIYPTILMVSLIILFTDYIVAGSRPLGYVSTAIQGQFYAVFQLISMCFLVYMIRLLVSGYMSAKEHAVQIKCAYAGLALVPHFASMVLVIVLMNMGLPVNGAMIFPLATTLFLIILLVSEKKHGLSDIRRFIPFSDERKTSNEIMDIFSRYAQDEANYRESINDIEKLLVTHKYNKNDKNASTTAEQMGMPRSSLYSLFNRLEINKDSK